MSRPSSYPDWTEGNPDFVNTTVEPSSMKKQQGYLPDEEPARQHFNWLIYNITQWLKAHSAELDNIEAILGGLDVMVEDLGSATQPSFTLTDVPAVPGNVIVLIDGSKILQNEWSLTGQVLTLVSPGSYDIAQKLSVVYLTTGGAGVGGGGGGGGGGSTSRAVEYPVLSSGDISAKSITLGHTPGSPTLVILDIIGGSPQVYGVDYIVVGPVLSWSGLGLDGSLSAGDRFRVDYNY